MNRVETYRRLLHALVGHRERLKMQANAVEEAYTRVLDQAWGQMSVQEQEEARGPVPAGQSHCPDPMVVAEEMAALLGSEVLAEAMRRAGYSEEQLAKEAGVAQKEVATFLSEGSDEMRTLGRWLHLMGFSFDMAVGERVRPLQRTLCAVKPPDLPPCPSQEGEIVYLPLWDAINNDEPDASWLAVDWVAVGHRAKAYLYRDGWEEVPINPFVAQGLVSALDGR